MIIILGLAVLTAIFFAVHFLTDDYEAIWAGIGAIFGIILVIALVSLPFVRASTTADVLGFNAVKQTLELARVNPDISEWELAAIQQKVVEQNRLLARAQYWATHPLTNWFYVPEILELEPIK